MDTIRILRICTGINKLSNSINNQKHADTSMLNCVDIFVLQCKWMHITSCKCDEHVLYFTVKQYFNYIAVKWRLLK